MTSRISALVAASAVAVALVLSNPAEAQWNGRHSGHGGWHGGGGHYHRGGGWNGGVLPGVALGLGIGALALAPYAYAPYYAPPPVYYAPPPVYYAPPPVYYAPPAYYSPG